LFHDTDTSFVAIYTYVHVGLIKIFTKMVEKLTQIIHIY